MRASKGTPSGASNTRRRASRKRAGMLAAASFVLALGAGAMYAGRG